MPEMPEVEGLRTFLAGALVGRTIARVELAAFPALKTFAVPLGSLLGQDVERVERRGKFLAIGVDGAWLTFHLARAGWLRWYDALPAAPAKPGRGPLALRFGVESDAGVAGFDLTEAGTQKKLAVYVVGDLDEVPGIAALGVDPLASDFTEQAFVALLAEHGRTQIKGVLRDQRILAGIGNAYSDEILQAARLSPYALAGSLTGAQASALYAALRAELAAAIARAQGLPPRELKDDKRNSLRIHGRKGQPCPTCGATVAEVSFADTFWNYCPGCQTGGRLLADRRLSKLLK